MSAEEKKLILAKNLKYYMAVKGTTRKDLCAAFNLPYMTVSDWINEKNYPRIDKLEMLANYFGVEISDLVEPHNVPNGERRSSPPTAELSKKEMVLDWIRNDATMEELSEIFRVIADKFSK